MKTENLNSDQADVSGNEALRVTLPSFEKWLLEYGDLWGEKHLYKIPLEELVQIWKDELKSKRGNDR